MRLRSYLLGLAVIASSFIAVNPVEAQSRNGWYKSGCGNNGECTYVKNIGGKWPYIQYKSNSPYGMFTKEADCHQPSSRFINSDGSVTPWEDVMPGSMGEREINIVCR